MPTKESTKLLPPLIDLPVYQEKYCDQEMTDTILQFIWDRKAEQIGKLAAMERGFLSSGHDGMYIKECSRILAYLKEHKHEVALPESRLGIVDLTYEMSRRIRKSVGLFDIPVLGHPLAPSPDDPLMPMVNLPVRRDEIESFTQGHVDEICQEVYKRAPVLMYESGEQFRRFVSYYKIDADVWEIIKSIMKELNQGSFLSYVNIELNMRLRHMCGIQEDLAKLKERILS